MQYDINVTKKDWCTKLKDNNIENGNHIVNRLILDMLDITTNDLILKKSFSQSEYNTICKAIKKIIKGYSIQRIVGHSYFYDVKILDSKHILSPRPETELIVDYVIKNFDNNIKVLDLCTGSGCIAISLNNNNFKNIIGSDISKNALKIANKNNILNNTNVQFIKSNLFKNIHQKFDLIISNPPYITSKDYKTLDRVVIKNDPKLALVAKDNGLKIYKDILKDIKNMLTDCGQVIFEYGLGQENDIQKLLQKDFCDIEIIKDLNNINRLIKGKLKNDK